MIKLRTFLFSSGIDGTFEIIDAFAMQDAWADVQLLLLLNFGVVVLAGLAKEVLIDGKEPSIPDLWTNVYEVRPAYAWIPINLQWFTLSRF